MNDTNLINEFKAELVRQDITIQNFIKENLVRHRRRGFSMLLIILVNTEVINLMRSYIQYF